MSHSIHDGIIDYLDIMQLAGVTELGPPELQKPERNQPEQTNVARESLPEPAAEPAGKSSMSKELPTKAPGTKSEQLAFVAKKVARCLRCEELARERTQTVFGVGNPDSDLVFLGEAPGADEDRLGEPFVGRAGKLLDDIIVKGMKLRREDVYICNILRCRPPGNRNPLPAEAEHCRPFLDQTLDIIAPKFICCLGAVAAKNLLHDDAPIGKLRGRVLSYTSPQDRKMKVVCTYHPAYLLRNPAAKKETWEDIKILMREMGLAFE